MNLILILTLIFEIKDNLSLKRILLLFYSIFFLFYPSLLLKDQTKHNHDSYSHMYILKPQSQQNHNQEKERLCCSSWTLLRQLVENLCPTGNGMTMNIIVKAHMCNWSCFTPARPQIFFKITFFGKHSRIENV